MSSLLMFNRDTVSHDGIFDHPCELLPLYLLSDLPRPSPPSQSKGGRVSSCVVDHILQEFKLCVSEHGFRTYKIAAPHKTKTPVMTTFRDWCLYSSFVHAYKQQGQTS